MWYDGGKGYLVPGTVVKSHPQGGVIVRSTEESEEVRRDSVVWRKLTQARMALVRFLMHI